MDNKKKIILDFFEWTHKNDRCWVTAEQRLKAIDDYLNENKMTIQEKIKNDLVKAMRIKDDAMKSILRVIIGEFNRIGKEVTDEQAIGILKKMYQNAVNQRNGDEAMRIDLYLPQQMDEFEIKRVCMNYIMNQPSPSMKMMGHVMGYLKENFGGQYDGKVASTIVRELLS